jgi:hypothetical protein
MKEVKSTESRVDAAAVKTERKQYVKPAAEEHEPLEESTAYVYYYYRF